jgi:UDP-glucose 4-epimerase
MREEPLVIYGDGQQTRDFLYVDDLVDAVLLADESETPGEVFQIASGRETSLKDLLAAMKRVLPGVKFDVRYEPGRAGEILRNYASIEKARRLLGYNPQTPLDQGLRNTWSWFVSQNARAASSQK